MAGENPASPSFPSSIGRYQIVDELGRGAMGVVYRGFDPNVGRAVAIKTVLLDAGDPEVILRFRREAQAAGILSHPSIVTIYDAGEDKGLFYIAMEFVEGDTLQSSLRKGPMAMERCVEILEQIGAALDHAHSRQIIHRDIKPANIVLTAERAKIMDFGVAKISAVGITTAGQAMGTPAYMSPEAVQGQVVDNRTDIFSLGVMFYEMLTGRRPFGGDSVATVMYKIMSEEVPPASAINQRLPPSMDAVFNKALAKDRNNRYANCADLVKDVKSALKGGAGPAPAAAAKPPAVPPPAQRASVSMPATPAAKPASAAWPRGVTPPVPPARVAIPYQVETQGRGLKIAGIAGAVVLLLGGGGLAFWKLWPKPETPAPQVAAPAPVKKAPKKKAPDEGAAATATPAAKAKPVAPPESGTMEVLVKSNVEGAQITIDGRTQPDWFTPHAIALAPGPHTIQVAKSGYFPKKQGILLNAGGRHEFTLNLTPESESVDGAAKKAAPESAAASSRANQAAAPAASGSLRVLTFPPGASITVDGKATPFRSPVIFPVPAGHHTVDLLHNRFARVTREVTITSGEIFELKVDLRTAGR